MPTPSRTPARSVDAAFPVRLIDLRPFAAGFDSGVAWLARVKLLWRLGTPIARWSRRLVVHIDRIHTQTFDESREAAYEMLQLWVSNGATEEAPEVRAQMRWTVDAALFSVKTEKGLWLGLSAQGGGGQPVSEVTALPGRVGLRQLGLVVKYLEDDHAYLVTPEAYHRWRQTQSWRWPSLAIAPGRHLVDVAFRSESGRRAILRLDVVNPGRGTAVRASVVTGQLSSA